ncbi:16S rRNA (cytosine(967)-C(5))-methyltransferase RsmB [Conexibacter stalactiti]|uniref:16S rRNA (cytosine(967)-C(5))-methyltransferase n=1 Tax=Conexibacter stalactiti TaxID=1940611 RepID=A0ABU4HYG4_9ACTN|nr:16S rRNA (cytosine(967)-C(5))-methyltransferase RsmB [Conexibacter stalactiti]MDW5597742.1 16S rRNA (cytosine(967)-C(5))-methyltransferase RsmB [Conexibacter stalactiti]MEC5038384.1 16S rRNA (cytosine(967)-C(5))-methyltransferase RsmB [Conexibacter stalactiti]
MPPVASAVSPARRVAATVLRRVEEDGAYADRALAGEAVRARLEPREYAFATALAFGAVQRRRTLDHVIERLARRPVEQLDPAVRDALRLGLLQLLFFDGVAPHAAVDQSVELAKAGGGHGFKLVNAVLRRAVREGPKLLSGLNDRRPRGAALLHSVPDWLARLWWNALGPDDARALLAHVNGPAETALRVNTLVAEPAAVAAELAERGIVTRPAALAGEELPAGLVVDGAFDLRGDPSFASGALVAQSRAATLAAQLLAPAPGMRVLDLCAAPGGKTTHLAALVEAGGAVTAVERHPGRAQALRETCARLRADAIVTVETGDAAQPRADGPFDAVLVDPPCSGLGTLQGRPDLRWRAREEAIGELAELQFQILAAGAAALRVSGELLYVTCTISPSENERVVQRFLGERAGAGFELLDLGAARPQLRSRIEPRTLQLLPHRDGTDGFFLAHLRRTA